jgi:hypothetical protein
MTDPITRYFREDHARLDALLDRAVARAGEIDAAAFAAFRAGILRHIAWEEKILLRAAKEARGGEPLPLAQRLRTDHGAIALLLVPTPTHEIVRELRSILEPHNLVEEGPGGLYETCETLLADRADEILEKVRAYPEVKLAPHYDGPEVFRRAKDALEISARQFRPRNAPTPDDRS